MEITSFPPFRLTVAAVDRITAAGGHLRISMTQGQLRFEPAPGQPGDEVFGCTGFQLALEPGLTAHLRGGLLDYRTGGEYRFCPGISAVNRRSTSPSPAQRRNRPAHRRLPKHRSALPAGPVPAPRSCHAA